MVHRQQSKSHRSKGLLDIFPTVSCSNAAETTCLQKTWSRLVILRLYSTLLQIKFLLWEQTVKERMTQTSTFKLGACRKA